MRRLEEVLTQITVEETKAGVEALMQEFAQSVLHQGLDDLRS
jgi:hypothetical protein